MGLDERKEEMSSIGQLARELPSVVPGAGVLGQTVSSLWRGSRGDCAVYFYRELRGPGELYGRRMLTIRRGGPRISLAA